MGLVGILCYVILSRPNMIATVNSKFFPDKLIIDVQPSVVKLYKDNRSLTCHKAKENNDVLQDVIMAIKKSPLFIHL